MDLPKNNSKLDKIFKASEVPEISEFEGEYFVDMLTGLPSLKKFSHRKIFYSEFNMALGHNILFKNKIWGRFFLEAGICEKLDSISAVIINYDRDKNSFFSRPIRDQVRRIEKNKLYLGRFNYLIAGKLFFLGNFSLTKIAKK